MIYIGNVFSATCKRTNLICYFKTALKLDCDTCTFGTENITLLYPNESNGNTKHPESAFMNVLNRLRYLTYTGHVLCFILLHNRSGDLSLGASCKDECE